MDTKLRKAVSDLNDALEGIELLDKAFEKNESFQPDQRKFEIVKNVDVLNDDWLGLHEYILECLKRKHASQKAIFEKQAEKAREILKENL